MSKNILVDLSTSMADAVEKASASTVLVKARRRIPASGIALSQELILTANHVVERDEGIKVTLPDGTELSAKLLGRDYSSDLAVLKLEKASASPAETNGDPKIGQLIFALGRPTQEGIQASLGIISAIGGPTRTRRGGLLEKYIRTDAVPYPGFSGGPLLDSDGKVIGINTSGLGHGNSIAIPIELAMKVAESIEKYGSVKRGYLGIRSQLVDIPEPAQKALKREQAKGLLVVALEDDSPAVEGGLTVGDIIVGMVGEPVESHDELMTIMTNEVIGKNTPLEVLRGGKPEIIKVMVGERKETYRSRRGRQLGPHMMFDGPFGRSHFKSSRSSERKGKPYTKMFRVEKHFEDDDEE